MLPWLVWSILAYLILSGAPVIDYIKTTAFHMEAAFWFLFSLWNIHLIFALSSLICYKLKGNIRIISILILCGVFDAFLMLVGLKLGMTFLGIKYTTYYLVFYLIGWILNLYITKHPEWSNKTWSGIAFMTFTVLFEVMLSKYSIVSMPDTSKWIALRFLVSLAGCLAVFYFVYNYTIKSEIFSSIIYQFSSYSLELYVVQHILLRHFVTGIDVDVMSSLGMINYCFFLILVIILTFLIIKILSVTPITRFVFFGKEIKKRE